MARPIVSAEKVQAEEIMTVLRTFGRGVPMKSSTVYGNRTGSTKAAMNPKRSYYRRKRSLKVTTRGVEYLGNGQWS